MTLFSRLRGLGLSRSHVSKSATNLTGDDRNKKSKSHVSSNVKSNTKNSPDASASQIANAASVVKERNSEQVLDQANDQSVDQPVEQPREQPIAKPVEKPVEKPVAQPVEKPVEAPVNQPTTTSSKSTSNGGPEGKEENPEHKKRKDGNDKKEVKETKEFRESKAGKKDKKLSKRFSKTLTLKKPATKDDESPSTRRLRLSPRLPKANTWKPPTSRESFEMVKRRVRVPIAVFDRPLTNEIEFVVDVRYHSVKVIGSGSFGVVASALDAKTDSRVAIKKILNAFSSSRMARYVLREVRLLHHLRHPNIVRLLDIDVPRQYRAWDEVYIVTPLLHTDLRSAMNDGIVKSSLIQKQIAYHLLLALEHMHSLGLMHRDVKSRNLLLDKDKNAQLCDLGHSRFYSKATRELDIELDREEEMFKNEPELTGSVTTMNQSAPEISLGAQYDVTVDIWAAGCVIAELVHPSHETLFNSGCHTPHQNHLQQIIQVVGRPTDEDLEGMPEHGVWYARLSRKKGGKDAPVDNALAEKLGGSADPLVVDLLENMLRFAPSKRLSATEALKHAWFDDVREETSHDREAYDFATSEPHRKASKADMKDLVWEEVVAFHPEAPNLGVR